MLKSSTIVNVTLITYEDKLILATDPPGYAIKTPPILAVRLLQRMKIVNF